MSPLRIDPLATTGIGSLPHTHFEQALELAFAVDIPYLPQLPQNQPAELLVPMALDGLPGLRWDAKGQCTVQLKEWRREAKAFDRRLDRALQKDELGPFEPQQSSCRSWKPFLLQLPLRDVRLAKVQLGGPVTCAWALRLDDGRRALDEAALLSQVQRLVLARSLAMVRAVIAAGATPILFFDEPGLVSLEPRHPQHLLRLQELGAAIGAVARAGARPGLHCCGQTKWSALLGLGLSYLSIDAKLSLNSVLENERAFEQFLFVGGRLSLGIVPTGPGAAADQAVEIARGVLASLERSEPGEKVLGQCLVTPACGLALGTVPDAERVFQELQRGCALLREAFAARS